MMRVACGLLAMGGWGLPPSEFRNMTPREWWLMYEVNVGRGQVEEADTKARLRRLYFAAKKEGNQ